MYLVCSDGLTSMVREDRVREIVAGAGSLQDAVDALVAEANEMGGRDNITVVLFRLGGDEAGATGEPALDETVVGLKVAEPETGEEQAVTAAPAAERAEEPPAARPRQRARQRRPRRTFRRIVAAAVVLVLLAGAVAGGIAAIRSVYFVGQDDRGLVTLFRGVPYELPFGIDLYESQYVSAVPARTLTPLQRRRLLDHQLRSRDDAADIVQGLERGSE
jgi:protein phosphatase